MMLVLMIFLSFGVLTTQASLLPFSRDLPFVIDFFHRLAKSPAAPSGQPILEQVKVHDQQSW